MSDETGKKHKSRRKAAAAAAVAAVLKDVPLPLLKEQIQRQAEYLFSTANLAQDRNMHELMARDASRQGSCVVDEVLRLAPRLNAMVNELATREIRGGDPAEAPTKAFFAAIAGSKILVLNGNNSTVKRNVFLPAVPDLFDPDARPPDFTVGDPPPPPKAFPPRNIAPRVWFPHVNGWEEEFHAHATASTQPRGNRFGAVNRRPRIAWRACSAAEKARFAQADFVIRRLWIVDLPPTGKDRMPEVDQWQVDEYFMTVDQLRQLEVRRQFSYMWRGEPAAAKTLKAIRSGAPDPFDVPLNDPDGDPRGLPGVLEREEVRVREEAVMAALKATGAYIVPQAKVEAMEPPVPGGQNGEGGLKTQLRFWQLDDQSERVDLAAQDLDPSKVPALATFIAATRNCQIVDIRSNPRLTAADGRLVAKALLANFDSRPAPRFLTTPPPPPPPINEADPHEVTARVLAQTNAVKALRDAIDAGVDPGLVAYRLQGCYDLGIPNNTDIERGQKLFVKLCQEVGMRVPNKGSVLFFNAMPIHTLRSGTASVADVSNCSLGATDIVILLELLVTPFTKEVPVLGDSSLASAGTFEHPSVGAMTVALANASFAHSEAAGGGGFDNPLFASFKPLSPSIFIEVLVLSGNEGMGDGGVAALAAAVSSHDLPLLSTLGLGGCGIGPVGFDLLARALRLHGETVTSLDLGQNRGGPAGLHALVEKYLFPKNSHPKFATAAEGAEGASHAAGGGGGVGGGGGASQVFDDGSSFGASGGLGGGVRWRDLSLKVLTLTQDVGSFSDRGDDMSAIETLAACLVHPDAACNKNLDLLYLGGAALPVKHLRGEVVEASSHEATMAATTFKRGVVTLPPDDFADDRHDAASSAGGAHEGPLSPGEQKRRKMRQRRRASEQQGLAVGGKVEEAPVLKSSVRDRLAARLGLGPMFKGEGYPKTDKIEGTSRGSALTSIDLSLQGSLLSVEDCVVIAGLVDENDSLEVLRLNSHKPLPVKALRGDEGHVKEILDFSNSYWFAQEVLVASRLLRHNRKAKTIRLCDNRPAVVAGAGAGASYPLAGLGDLAQTLTPPMRGLHGPQLSVVGRPPPRGGGRRREGQNLSHLLGVVSDDILREGRPPLFDPTNWFTACRPDFVDLSNCGIASKSGDQAAQKGDAARNNPHADPSPLDLLTPVLRGLYCWGLEHALAPDSLVLIRKDRMPVVDAHIRAGGDVPDRLSSPYSPYRKQRAKRGGVKHLNSLSSASASN